MFPDLEALGKLHGGVGVPVWVVGGEWQWWARFR